MATFLLWIGAYNLLGALFVPAFARESTADRVLRRWIEVIAVPYSHGVHGPLWVWWAASTNLSLGLIMVLASRWQAEAQRGVTIAAVLAYVIMFVAALVAARSRSYKASGIYGTLVLWIAQIGWGVTALVRGWGIDT